MVWWRGAVLYQIYVRSFADSGGDGIGDLDGVIDHLDHLAWLGIDGLWLSPVHPSPNEDWGYDVADHFAVEPALGTLADLDRLIDEAGRRDIRIVLDLVPNHTSDRHPWFIDARSSRAASHRDWYVWADPKPDGSPPNNWLSAFGGPAWTCDTVTGQYYLHNFLPAQPDLNWWNDEVRDEFDRVLRFWFDRGVAGFRIDVCHMIVKDRELRDNPPAGDDDPPFVRLLGQKQVFNAERPEGHEVLRRWRRVADAYDPPRLLLGETYVFDVARMSAYYGAGDELDLAFNIPFLFSDFTAESLRSVVEATERRLGPDHWPVWTASNHDVSRYSTRWCGADPAKVRCALLALLALRGTTVLYYGDEIGMPDTSLRYEDLRDPVGKRFWPSSRGRDPARTPMHWSQAPGAGFTEPASRAWLPIGDARRCNVEDERADSSSVLTFCRDLIALRRARKALRAGAYRPISTPGGVWAWARGEDLVIVVNLADEAAVLDSFGGTILIATQRDREGEKLSRELSLDPWEGVLLEGSVAT